MTHQPTNIREAPASPYGATCKEKSSRIRTHRWTSTASPKRNKQPFSETVEEAFTKLGAETRLFGLQSLEFTTIGSENQEGGCVKNRDSNDNPRTSTTSRWTAEWFGTYSFLMWVPS
jgi:hypothetical protein